MLLIVLLPMKLQGSPPLPPPHNSATIEELENIIEQLQEVVRSQYHPKQLNSHAQSGAATVNSAYRPFEVSTQVQGVNIRNCGSEGDIIHNALSSLNIFSSWFGVLVDCQHQGDSKCGGTGTRIRVDVPANTIKADVRVCNRKSKILVHCDSVYFSAEQLLIQVMIIILL